MEESSQIFLRLGKVITGEDERGFTMYDVIIIGAGVVGCAVARELSAYQGRFCVLERQEDVCCGTSKANSGLVRSQVPGRQT